jgi:hypothetical protein
MRMIVEAFKDALELGLQKENQVVVSVASAISDAVVLALVHERTQIRLNHSWRSIVLG